MEQDFYNIDIKGLSIGFSNSGKHPVILREGINFSANHGEMVALIGSNGIGKSTLLRSLAGFQDYLAGDFFINDKSIRKITGQERARLISFVSTEIVRVANMSVFDLVALGRFPYTNWLGKLAENDKRIIEEALDHVGMTQFRFKQATRISDGERQRVMIARALAQDTPIIILDEPTAFLDVSNKYEIFHLLQTLATEKDKTIVLSTHDLNIALREVDKFWIMQEAGTYEGSPEDAVLDGIIDSLFINSHIGFDLDEGEYYFKKEFREKVKIVGEGPSLKWTLRAFNRMGYQIVMDAKPDFTVYVNKNPVSWELAWGNNRTEFKSIYDMFRSLRRDK